MDKQTEKPSASRRKALSRLGLGVAVAYVAPTILHLDRITRRRFNRPATALPARGTPGAILAAKAKAKVNNTRPRPANDRPLRPVLKCL